MRRSQAPSQFKTGFKTPLLTSRKPLAETQGNAVSSPIVTQNEARNEHEDLPPQKKLKMSSLIPKKTSSLKASVETSSEDASAGKRLQETQAGGYKYFTVVWRKQTKKKHKTWDGDGILIISGKTGVLKDAEGKDIGKVSNIPIGILGDGDELAAGGKDIEIIGKLDPELYNSGRCFLAPSLTSIQPSTSKPATKFKKPIMFSDGKAMAAAASVSAAKPPIPRHDPTVDGSLVMPRPSHTHQAKWNARKRPLVDVVVDPLLCAHLREHQRQGVQFLYECVMGMKEFDGQGAILADEMGLGKTLQTIALLWTLLKQNPYHGDQPTVKRALVVCPTTLINNWKQEFKKWLGDERIRAFVVDSKANIGDFLHGKIYNVMIIGYEKLRTVQELLSDAQFDIVVCDEGHRLKSQNIKTAQAIRTLLTKRRIILSGTPIQNDLGEFFAMVNFINPALFDSYTSFKKVFEEPIVRSRQPDCSPADVDLGKARADELTRLTNMFILRRTSQVIAKYLPPKIELVLFCRPSPLQRDLYDCFLGTPALRCLTTAAASEHLSCITALKKLCNSPSLTFDSATKAIDEGVGSSLIYAESRCLDAFPPGFDSKKYDPVISGKLMVLDHILTELRASTKEKVVLVSNYTQTLDILEGMCNKHEYDFFRLDGSTPSGKRQEYVDRFNSPTCNKFVFLLSSKSGGVGLNLIGASRLILFDVDWNPSVDLQAMARIHRDGQRRKVYIYRLLTTGTIDEKIYQRQMTKMGLSDSLMDQKKQAGTNQFTTDDLRDLFTLHDATDCQTHDLLECECLDGEESSKHGSDRVKRQYRAMDDSAIAELNEWTHLPPDRLNELEDEVLVRMLQRTSRDRKEEGEEEEEGEKSEEEGEDASERKDFGILSFAFYRKTG